MADETEKLIDLVRECVYLYDVRHPDYKDVVKKAEAWKDIADKLHESSEAVKLKWKNLRDSYVKYLKFLKGATGSAKKFKNWPWAANLEFLQDTVSPRVTASNIPQTGETDDPIEEASNEGSCATDDSQIPPPQKKSKPKDVSTDVHAIIKYLNNKKDNKPRNNLDRIDHLFLSYAETFKRFLPRTQAVIKMEMAQMFGRAELRELETSHPSSPLNSSSSSWPPNCTATSSGVVDYTDLNYTNKPPFVGIHATSGDSAKEWYDTFQGHM